MCEDIVVGEAAADALAVTASDSPRVPNRSKRSLAYLISALAGGNILSAVFRMAGGLLQARCVNPTTLGTFGSIGLWLGWSRFLQLGIFNGLNRELPYYFGKGDGQRARELAATGRTWAVFLGLLVGAGFLGKALWCGLRGDGELAVGWGAYAVLAFIFFYATQYLAVTYRTAHDFARLSLANVVQNGLGLVLVLTVYWFGFNGLCLRAVLAGLVGLAMLHAWQPIRVGCEWKFSHFRHILVIGFPIFVVGELGGSLWMLVDSTLVNLYLKERGLGLYNMVTVARDTFEILPLAMGQIMYPRMTEHYGRTHDLPSTMTMVIKPAIAVVAGMVPLVIAGWILAGPVTRLVLPKYVDAVPAMQWSLLLPLVMSFSTVNNVYNICRRQALYAVVILLSMASYAGTLMWLARNGSYLAAFPQALLVGRIVYVLAGYAFLIPVYRSWRKGQADALNEVSREP